MKTMSTARWRH